MTLKPSDRVLLTPEKNVARRWRVLLGCLLVVGLAVWVFPHVAGAYHLLAGGRQMRFYGLTGTGDEVAEHQLRRALDWRPRGARAHRMLGQLYAWREDWLASAQAWTRYVALEPTDLLGYLELSAACEQLTSSDLARIAGQPCGVDELSRRAAMVSLWQMGGLSAAHLVQAGDRFRLGRDWEDAADSYSRALIVEPESLPASYGQGEVFQALGEVDKALGAYARVLEIGTDTQLMAAAHSRRGEMLADRRHWAEAKAELEQALALVPDEGHYHLEYGWYAFQADSSPQQARAELAQAAELLPDDAWPHLRLGDIDFAQGNLEGMLAHAQYAISLQPDLFWGWLMQGQALRHLGRLAEAEDALGHAIELAPAKAVLHSEMGHLLKQAARVEEAIPAYRQAVELAPDNAWYQLSLADAYQSDGQTSEAVEAYRRVLQLRPGNVAAREALQELGH